MNDIDRAATHACRRILAAMLLLASATPSAALPAAPAPAPAPSDPSAWLYAGSDIARDPAWRFGILPNGLRYAARRNPTPTGTVSIRVRIAAGALEERADERGFAHFLEHMTFRGTAGVPDGEGVRIWQRLGASFGADTNATTSLTATTYMLDLPRADPTSLDTAMSVLSGMMRSATLAPAAIAVERNVVLAERAARIPPLARRAKDLARPLLSTGLLAEQADVGGSDRTLAGATSERLRAFYDRWYRPDHATLVIVGDLDVDRLEALAVRHFGSWSPRGPAPAQPDYGAPIVPQRTSAMLVDPQATDSLALFWVRAHDDRPWTNARQSAEFVREVAVRILNRRLARRTRGGAAFVAAGAGFAENRHGADLMQVAVSPRPGAWAQALDDLYGVLADCVANPPDQAEIAREVAELDEASRARITAEATIRSPALATLLVRAVDEGDVVATATDYAMLLTAAKPLFTPAAVGATLRSLIAGDPRTLLTSSTPVVGGDAALTAALVHARTIKAAARTADRAVRFTDLAPVAAPGRILSRTEIADYGATRVRFANGVDLIVKRTPFDKDRIAVTASVGNGMAALDPRRPAPTWSLGAVPQGGIGPFDADALERLVAGRRLSMGVALGDHALDYSGFTNQQDLLDQLRLLAAAVTEPRFDASALDRLKVAAAGNEDARFATPGGVAGTMLPQIFHPNDLRYAYPSRATIAALTPQAWRGFWTPLLAPGIRRVVILGDVDVDAAIRAVAVTIGAAPARPQPTPRPDWADATPPAAAPAPLLLRHRGDPAQAIAVRAWPTTGALADLAVPRTLRIAADIVQTRLFDRFREAEGGSYSPSVASTMSLVQPSYGVFVAASELRRDRITDFDRALDDILADLARDGPTADEAARAVTPIVGAQQRALLTNGYWQGLLAADIDDPRLHRLHATTVSGYQAVTPDAIRDAVRRWIADRAALRIRILGPDAR